MTPEEGFDDGPDFEGDIPWDCDREAPGEEEVADLLDDGLSEDDE